MSAHQNGTTSSNLIKQEDEDGEQPDAVPQLAQPPTSLLSLPNDILLLVYDEVYNERYNLITADTPLQIAEILVNKRIFSLARPLWFKHLSVSESHLDLRLAGIFDDKARRRHLRSLDVDVDNSHYNLVKSALLRLPDLTDLALKLPRDFSPHAFTVLVDAVSSLPALKRLRLRSDKRTKKLADFWKAYLGANPCTEVNVSYSFSGMVLQKEYPGTTTGRLLMVKSFELTPTTLGFLSPSSWPTFLSLTLWAPGGLLAWNDEVLEGLETAIENETIYLERLKLQITFRPSQNPETYRCFAPSDYEQLLQLLQRTNLQQLHLASLQRIPDTPSTVVIGSVRLLRLSGSCSFKDSQSFQNLFALLSALPSLTQLHLAGSSFFDASSSVAAISKCKAASLSFRYPELGVLLTFLQSTNVVIFTYRGGEKREMRWTRLNKEEDFVRDCWTL